MFINCGPLTHSTVASHIVKRSVHFNCNISNMGIRGSKHSHVHASAGRRGTVCFRNKNTLTRAAFLQNRIEGFRYDGED